MFAKQENVRQIRVRNCKGHARASILNLPRIEQARPTLAYARREGRQGGLVKACTFASGITVHLIFSQLNILPTERPPLGEMIRFQIDYTFWLNAVFVLLGGALLWLYWRGREKKAAPRPAKSPTAVA